MAPFIKDADIITVSPLVDGRVSVGVPVAFIHPGRGNLVVHRIIARARGSYFIKGDNSPEADGWVHQQNILGYVSSVERNNRRWNFGLGKEAFLIAFLSRHNLLLPLFRSWRCLPDALRKLLRS